MSLLDIQVQVEPPLHARLQEHLQVATLQSLQAGSTESPTMVWHHAPLERRYCQWVSHAQHTVLTITAAELPQPWVELW